MESPTPSGPPALRFGMRNEQPLMLGLFGLNVTGSTLISTAPTSFEVSWRHSREVARIADRMGLDMLVSIARWSGFGGLSNLAGEAYETLTYIAGLAAVTENIQVFSTVHAPIVHPLLAAKALATIDHISGGRAGLNVVMGWNERDMGMFGIPLRAHDERYAFGAEWLEIVDRLWTSAEPFDVAGEYFTLTGALSAPPPVQRRLPVLNAGASEAGIDYSARHADLNFTSFQSFDHVAQYRDMLREKSAAHGRDVGLLSLVLVVCRDTEAEARAAYEALRDEADLVAGANFVRANGVPIDLMSEPERRALLLSVCIGPENATLVGTPEQIVERLLTMRRAGVDGLLLGFQDYLRELPHFAERVMPLLKEVGLRV